MKNRLPCLLLAIGSLAFIGSVSAYEINCPVNGVEIGQGSSNSIKTPMFYTSSSWRGSFHITNVSDKPVTVKLDLTDKDGQSYTPYSVGYESNFSTSNTPINLSAGAVLQPGQLGGVIIYDSAETMVNVGDLSWQSDYCLEEALVVNYSNAWWSSTAGYSVTPLNGGQPF